MENGITGAIFVPYKSHGFRLEFERYHISDQIEKLHITGEINIDVQSDRPYLKANNKRKSVEWKVISDIKQGMFSNSGSSFLVDLFQQLEWTLDAMDFPRGPKFQKKSW